MSAKTLTSYGYLFPCSVFCFTGWRFFTTISTAYVGYFLSASKIWFYLPPKLCHFKSPNVVRRSNSSSS